MPQTLDQQRAALAWGYATSAMKTNNAFASKYKNLAKGAPALIMNSGLMPTLAFYSGKDPEHKQLLDDLIRGLRKRLDSQDLKTGQGDQLFPEFMEILQKSESRDYMRYTDEALELLKWIRQFVSAVEGGDHDS